MALYIRKSLSVGPLRFNLSNSGVGVSAGIPGFRVGAGPRGNYVHVGRGGLYFRQTLGPSSGRRVVSRPRLEDQSSTAAPLEDIDSGSVFDMTDGSSSDLLAELNEKRQRMRRLPFVLIASAVALYAFSATGTPLWQLAVVATACALACWLTATNDTFRKTTVMFYELEPDVERTYEELLSAFADVMACRSVWHVSAQGNVLNRKYHAGAAHLVTRRHSALKTGEPPLVKSNIDVPLIPAGRQTLALMPDRVLVFDTNGVGAVNYQDLAVQRGETRFIEEQPVPSDAAVVGSTWRYVNKSGGPDRRFANNRQLPICVYDELHFTSGSGLNELFQCSRKGSGTGIVAALVNLKSRFASAGVTS